MLKENQDDQKKPKKFSTLFFLLSFTLLFLFSFFIGLNSMQNNYDINTEINNNKIEPESSSIWALLNLTNLEMNNTRHYHNDTIPIEGKLYLLGGPGIEGYLVGIYINDIYSQYSDTTNNTGGFRINLTIPLSLNIYTKHKIYAKVIGSTPGPVLIRNHFMIETNATSYFNIPSPSPGIPGEDYSLSGYLSYDNTTGIPSKWINSTWINGTDIILNPKIMTGLDGSFPTPLTIPNDSYSSLFYLNLTYFGDPFVINGSQTMIQINLFKNITCIWYVVSTAAEGDQITIRGQVLSKKSKNPINNREVEIYYGGIGLIRTMQTDVNGYFQFTYQIPPGTGDHLIEVEIVNSLGLNILSNTTHYITITGAVPSDTSSPSGKSTDSSPPLFNFFMVLIPIVIGGIAAFAIYAYFYLRKQEEQSRLVKLPLEGKIRNLKILKDTGRLEESLSYLFQAIYLELINAKYGRRKGKTETIRDFAIISVKELNLNPANIYPFIQNVEKIIYDKPFIITEEEFYTAVDLFSPIYFELTGYNFILNF
jgi:hypothetical protein